MIPAGAADLTRASLPLPPERARDLRNARTAFVALGLSGYARVDFRVDAEGPWILEVNANPCISPDAGFAAALAQSGIRYKDAIARIIRAALGDH